MANNYFAVPWKHDKSKQFFYIFFCLLVPPTNTYGYPLGIQPHNSRNEKQYSTHKSVFFFPNNNYVPPTEKKKENF